MTSDTVIRGKRWQVVFVRQGDRFGCRISLLEGDQVIPLLESVEGAADELWPPSPPLQSLHVERRGDEQLALLVGMAGPNHWSLAVTLAERDGYEELTFDAACRVAGARTGRAPAQSPHGAEWLGSTYQVHAAYAPSAAGGELRAKSASCHMVASEDRETATEITSESGETATVRFVPGRQDAPPATRRWAYRFTA